MLSLSSLPPVSILSMYTTFAAAMMLIRTVLTEVQTLFSQLLPQHLRDKLMSKFGDLSSSQIVLTINQQNGFSLNELYEASELYLSHKFTSSVRQLQVSKTPRDKAFSFTLNKGQKVVDSFQKMQLNWNFHSIESQKSYYDDASYENYTQKCELKSAQLSFHSKHKDMVMSTYLPYIVERSKAIKEEQRAVKLYAQGSFGGQYDGGHWGSVNLDHPSTFDTMAMDPEVKKELMEDLDRFVKRKEFYRRVGKAWKRGYLLYGPPGTGKSSLIAAMANYLKFDIYDVELSSQHSNSELRDLLVTTKNQSVLVIEDIDCGIELQDRSKSNQDSDQNSTKLTLSGLLNFIDGLWSSCGDERIIVFTTNYKERLDPALLRPGRMDKHIHMSYCTPCGFKVLANNYLRIKTHKLFDTIEQLIMEVEVTPAEVAEELMVSEDVEVVLVGLVQFLQVKKKQNKPCLEAEPTNGEDIQVIEGNK